MCRKRGFLGAAVMALGLVVVYAAPASATLLNNGGFETGDLTGWNLGPPTQTVGAPGVGAQSGSFALEMVAPADGVPEVNQGSFSGIGPIIPASPGQEFNLSGYMLTETALPAVGTGATFGLFKIVFEDAAGVDLLPASASIGIINGAFPGIESTPLLDGNVPVNTWILSQAQGVAPAGTASVQFLALDVDFGNLALHPMWYDSISATVVPEPTGAALALMGLVGLGLRRRR